MADVEGYKEEVRRSFELVKPISVEAAAIFYPTLWEINPDTKPLFKETDMEKQGKKLMKVLGVAVSMLRTMDALIPVLENLGRRHVSYGVTPEMYPSVGEALLITLEKGLGKEFRPETKEAWTWVYGVMSEVCIRAANEVQPTATEDKLAEPVAEGSEEKTAKEASTETAPAEKASAETAPVEKASTETAPVKAAPVKTVSAKTTSLEAA